MSLSVEEIQTIRALPKRRDMCPKLQKAKDKTLTAALTVALGSTDLAETAMRVVRECRG